MLITLDILKAVYPTTSSDKLALFVAPLNKLLPQYGITSVNEVSAFIAQVGHESANFGRFTENLNYTAAGLRRVFRKYFPTQVLADRYARQPQAIANRVYANRMGNGNERSGDGWRYRGKGLIQVTGHDNHAAFAKFMEMTVNDAVAYMLTAEGAVMSAIWFWKMRDCGQYCNKADGSVDMLNLSKRINGGVFGLQDRVDHFVKVRKLLNASRS